MNRIALITILFAAACATSGETVEPAAREGDVYEIVPAEPRPQLDKAGKPIPGTLLLDTSEGRMDITHLVPDKPREFASWEAFHGWAGEALNAQLVANEKGEITSQLRASYGPAVRYDADADDGFVIVENPINVIVGGTAGYIVVDGKPYCMDPAAPCALEQTVTPARVENHIGQSVSRSSNGLTVNGASSIFHMIALHEIKAATRLDASRGFVKACAFLGFWCSFRGSDFLSASFSAFRSTGSIFNGSASARQANTDYVAASHFGFGVSYSSSSPVGIAPGSAGVIEQTDSMCSSHSGNDTIGFVSFPTMSGYHPAFGGC